MYRKKQQYERALADCDKATSLAPTYPGAFLARGATYSDMKDYDHAIADLTETLRLDPTLYEAFQHRGKAYIGRRDYDRAADLSEAIIGPEIA
jgi:tetratricopeptide (TPR) repeat protein